jgi:hypothetical protein
MKTFGVILMIAGVIWMVVALSMSTTVTSSSEAFGSEPYAMETPSVTVNNIGLMDRRHNNLMLAGLTILIGAVFFGFGSISERAFAAGGGEASGDLVACPYCAELIKLQASVCKHCGRDVAEAVAERTRRETEQRQPEKAEERAERHRHALELCKRLRREELDIFSYTNLANETGATFKMDGSVFGDYVFTRNGSVTRFKRYRMLRPWFLENVVPQIEANASLSETPFVKSREKSD